jgi:predicted methyltransferase
MNTRNLRLVAALSILGATAIALPAIAADAPASPAAPATAAPAAVPYVVPADTPAYIKAAVEASTRTPEQKARDFNRKPAELLTMSGIKPRDRVVEFASAGQYFTPMLSDIVGPKGMVYMFDLPYTEQRAGAASRAFVASHPNSRYELIDYNLLNMPEKIDVVYIVLYYHDLPLNKIDTAALNAKILKSLKPGGIYFIVDHNARPGSGTEDTQKLHRIDPAVIKQEVTAAGFELVEESKLLARADDDHTKMVFTPGLRGLTDQSVFKFRKPKK